jgi:CRISPR-associated protein Csd1
MLLQKLKEYADAGRVENMAPVGYKETPIRYVVDLDAEGRFLGWVDQAQGGKGREKRGKVTFAPHVGRSSGVRAKLLADNAEYALGIARDPLKQGRVDEARRAFVDLARACALATADPRVAAVSAFLEAPDDALAALPGDFDPSAVMTFRVDGQLPIDLPAVREFWAHHGSGEPETADGDATGSRPMQCLVCGQWRPPVERLPYKWQGIPGGQSSGLALISANSPAFESYGLEASLVAPTCAECGERFSKAALALLGDDRTRLRVGQRLAYVFWTRDPVPDFSFAAFFTDPQSTDVGNLLRSPRRGDAGATDLDDTPFYAAALSASGARVVVREWLDTTLGRVKENLRRYFRLQELVGTDGNAAPLKLIALAGATVRELNDVQPEVAQAILRVALNGGALPSGLLYQVVQRCRAEGGVNRPQAALIKAVLLSQLPLDREEGIDVTEGNLRRLDPGDRRPAYLCGRLLAVLEATQRAALGDVNATIVDRYYGTASSAPASVFPRLLRGAQPHLGKLRRDRRGAFIALENRLMDLMNGQGGLTVFPRVLSLPEQGLFALGYYHQRADDRAAARAHRELRALVTGGETAEPDGAGPENGG